MPVPWDPPGRGWCQAPPWAPDGGPVGLVVGRGIFPLLLLILYNSSELRARGLVENGGLRGTLVLAPWRLVGNKKKLAASLLPLSFIWEWMA